MIIEEINHCVTRESCDEQQRIQSKMNELPMLTVMNKEISDANPVAGFDLQDRVLVAGGDGV
jgi:hypothetical protein